MAVSVTDEEKRAIADRLREWAESQFPTLADCAKTLGVTAQHLHVYLGSPDKEVPPSLPGGRLNIRLADAGLNLNWLMRGRGKMLESEDSGQETISVIRTGDHFVIQATIPIKQVKNMSDT